jgi:hypothetical protein
MKINTKKFGKAKNSKSKTRMKLKENFVSKSMKRNNDLLKANDDL